MSDIEQIAYEVRSGIGILGEAPAALTLEALQGLDQGLGGILQAVGSVAAALELVSQVAAVQLTAAAVTHRRAFDGAAALHETLDTADSPEARQTLSFADAMQGESDDQMRSLGSFVAVLGRLRATFMEAEALTHEALAGQADAEAHATAVHGAQRGAIDHGQRYLAQITSGDTGPQVE